MRKSIKWTAVCSAAAIMAAITSAFAVPAMAQEAGWVQEDNVWKYYDSDGYALTDSWKKYDNDWYYLDENGQIAVNRQIDEYYVNAEGKRVADTWVSIANEDFWDEKAPELYWYYYGSSGKMVASKFKTIGEDTYYFDEEGRMATGLQEIEGNHYYFSESGAMKKGWVQLPNENSEFDDEMAWSYFDAAGKRIEDQLDKKINGGYYTFTDGSMVTGWYKLPVTANTADSEEDAKDAAETTAADSEADAAEAALTPPAAGYQYYDESGKRASGWMTITGIPGVSAEDETYQFYFKNGVPYFSQTGIQIFGIGSDRYGFNDKGEMQTGLQVVTLEDGSTANFYFDAKGAMKTGKQTIFDDDSAMNQVWYFHTEGSLRGQGYHGIRSNVIYDHGLRLEADSDLRYAPVTFEGQKYLVNASGTIQKASASSRSASRPDLGDGYRDVRDANDTVWTVNEEGLIQ